MTGSSGFVGQNLIRYFIHDTSDVHITGLDMKHPPSDNPPYRHCQFDLSKAPLDMTDRHDVIIHLAGQPSVWYAEKNPQEDFQANVISMLHMLGYGIAHKIPIIYLSTIAVYESSPGILREEDVKPHTTWYGMNKHNAEQYCEFACTKYGMPYVVLRAGYLYDTNIVRGPIADIRTRGNLYKYNHPDSVFDFLHIEDLYRAMSLVIQSGFHRSGIYNISSGIGTSIRSIGDAAGEVVPENVSTNAIKQYVLDTAKFKGDYRWNAAHDLFKDIIKEPGS
ncbi:MAG: NAD(P)-dependent oxidoreductase [Spirochaetes bacterium]|nr:NAD(P)-dependent oxidoreductase [Spirochaetota bacterium]